MVKIEGPEIFYFLVSFLISSKQVFMIHSKQHVDFIYFTATSLQAAMLSELLRNESSVSECDTIWHSECEIIIVIIIASKSFQLAWH